MRALNTDAEAVLARMKSGEKIGMAQLVELRFSPVLYLTNAGGRKRWNSQVWTTAGLGPVQAIEDSAVEMPAMSFSMPGLTPEQRALALEPGVEGKTAVVYDALCDPDTGAVVDTCRTWIGSLNVPTLIGGGKNAALGVTAEHRGMLALRPKPSRYTSDEQQRRYPGDTSLDFDAATDAGPFPWPAASYFKR